MVDEEMQAAAKRANVRAGLPHRNVGVGLAAPEPGRRRIPISGPSVGNRPCGHCTSLAGKQWGLSARIRVGRGWRLVQHVRRGRQVDVTVSTATGKVRARTSNSPSAPAGAGRLPAADLAAPAVAARRPVRRRPKRGRPSPPPRSNSRLTPASQPFLQQNCYRCHANGKKKGDFSLDGFKSLSDVQNDRRTWATVVDVLRQKVMPPEDRPQPAPADVSAVTEWIGDALTHCDCSGPRDPGRVAIHRLNRAEYNNTIRDLLAIDFHPADDFPADDTGYGFDNIADVLSMSPLLAEKYLSAAEQALDKAVVLENPLANKTRHFDCSGMDATGGNAGGELGKNGECFANIDFVADAPYEFRIRAGQDKFGNEPARMTFKMDGQPVVTFDVRSRARPHARLPAADERQGAAGTRSPPSTSTTRWIRHNPDPKKRGDRNLYVESWEIGGPFDLPPPPPPESYRRIFFKKPGKPGDGPTEEACARELIARFATRAFRRPATADEADGLMKLYRMSRGQGDGFEPARKGGADRRAGVAALFVPHRDRPAGRPGHAEELRPRPPASAITSRRPGSRYFLWSSMPDEELFDLAGGGQAARAGRDRGPGPPDAPGPQGRRRW